jgi:tripartite ATP-independent transporter DctM subunit
MSPEFIGSIGLIVFVILMALKFPIAVSMSIVGVAGFACLTNVTTAFKLIPADLFSTFSGYSMSTIAMFVLMGYLACHSGLTSKLYNFAYKLVGRQRGGLASASVIACTIFGAICGSYAATAAIVGSAAIPEMRKRDYGAGFATATIAAGGVIGTLIPPSVTFIIYGNAAQQSVNKLFLSGIIPGVLVCVCDIIAILLVTKKNPAIGPAGTDPKPTGRELLSAAGDGLIGIAVVFLISIGGTFMGFFTPTEAGGIGSVGIVLVALLARSMSFASFFAALRDSSKTICMILFMIGGATIFGRFIAISRIPAWIGDVVSSLQLPSIIIMIVIFLIYVFLGCFMDTIPMILLTVPIFYPVVVTQLGYDPIWFGTIVIMCTCIGAITPPVGANVYVAKGLAPDVPLEKVFAGVWPFVISTGVATILVLFIPYLAIGLPTLFGAM